MKKGLKIIIIVPIVIVASLVTGFASLIYFAGQFSATYPHLKDYEYSKTAKELETDLIQTLKSDASFSYTITDVTGTGKDRNYYMTINQNLNNNLYSYYITYSNNSKSTCNLGLVGVFDITNKSGGYQDDDKDVEKLISIFDNQLIDKVK